MKLDFKLFLKRFFVIILFLLTVGIGIIHYSLISLENRDLLPLIYWCIVNAFIALLALLTVFLIVYKKKSKLESFQMMRLTVAVITFMFCVGISIFAIVRIDNHRLFHSSEGYLSFLFIVNFLLVLFALVDSLSLYNRIEKYSVGIK